MISLYSGTPGSGKSLHVASRIYWKLRRGLPVIANFDFAADRVRGRGRGGEFIQRNNDELDPAWLRAYSGEYFKTHRFKEETILLVIDEAQLMFNAREWSAAGRAEWLSFFTQHRKFGYEVILVAQFDRMLDRQIRSLLEYEYIHRKVSNFGLMGWLLSIWTLGRLFCAVKMWYPLREKVSADWFVARKKYYSLYDTYKHFDEDKPVEDGANDDGSRVDPRGSAVLETKNGVKFYEAS